MASKQMCGWQVLALICLITTVTAKPEIPSKGKHARTQDVQQTSLEDADMPRFAEPIANVTVSVGRDALLACVVENLKGYKVAWVRVDTQTILSIHHNVISQNNRISLTYNDHRSWYLHIKEVEESDRGWYMCQVNTDPMRSRKGYLQVVVPPVIVESLTSNDMVVREGLNVTLQCKARGYPEPYVMWRREDGEEMLIGGEHVNVVDGEFLHITKVSRLHMAAYLCVASNGVPPSISKRVHLRVQFPPMLSIPNQLEGAYVGQDVMLECHTEAYPASINYWTTERGDMIISDTSRAGDKYETTSTISGYTKYMKLKIRSVGPNDFGTYRCVAKNSLGETDGNIKLDEMPAPTTAVMSEMAMLNRSLDGKRRHRNKFDMNALPDYGVEEWRDGAGNALGNGIHGPHGSSLNSAGFNGIGGGGGDNNQTPVRNPPGAFHNSAGSLAATHNLVGTIIQRIKMQSFGIFERLSSYLWRPTVTTTNNVGKDKTQKPPAAVIVMSHGGDHSSNNKSNAAEMLAHLNVSLMPFFRPIASLLHVPSLLAAQPWLCWPVLIGQLMLLFGFICIMFFIDVKRDFLEILLSEEDDDDEDDYEHVAIVDEPTGVLNDSVKREDVMMVENANSGGHDRNAESIMLRKNYRINGGQPGNVNEMKCCLVKSKQITGPPRQRTDYEEQERLADTEIVRIKNDEDESNEQINPDTRRIGLSAYETTIEIARKPINNTQKTDSIESLDDASMCRALTPQSSSLNPTTKDPQMPAPNGANTQSSLLQASQVFSQRSSTTTKSGSDKLKAHNHVTPSTAWQGTAPEQGAVEMPPITTTTIATPTTSTIKAESSVSTPSLSWSSAAEKSKSQSRSQALR